MADTIFINGAIRTLDETNPEASFIAVKEGKIIGVGKNGEDIAQFIEEGKTQTVDLKGKPVLPGFVESHNHFNAVAGQWGWVDVGIKNCATISEVIETIKEAAQKTREAYESADPKPEFLPWVKCVGFDDTLVAENRNLVKQELDSVSEDLPVWVWHPSLHRAYVNSKAFEISGIDNTVEDPEAGKFVRDSEGNLTGQIEEMAAFQKVYMHLNKTIDPRTKGRDMWATARYFASRGVTSVQDLFVGPGLFMLYKAAFQAHTKENPFPIRVSVYSPPWEDRPAETGFDQDFLKFAGTKLFADGSIQCHTACCSQPYLDEPDAKGILTIPADRLKQIVLKFQSIGRQIAIHCNGDEAIELFIQAAEEAQAAIPRPDIRHRIEHCQLVSDEQLARMKKAGICVSFFIGHVYYWGDRHRNIFLGEERARRISPLNSALKAEVPFALHCDCPVTPVDPLHSIWISAARLTKSNYELGPEQKISVEQAIRAYTIDAAYLAFEEKVKGSLEVGKFADFIVLSQDPLNVPVNEIPSIQIEETFVGGRSVYSSSSN